MVVHRSRLLLEQVLEDQRPPALVPRVNKRTTLFELPEIDGCETELFGEGLYQRCGTFVVARQEHDSPATMYGRILVKDGSDQMVEALNQTCTSDGRSDGIERQL